MMRFKPHFANVQRYADRHGRPRYYYRKSKPFTPLPGPYGSLEFAAAHAAAEAAYKAGKSPSDIGASRVVAGSIRAALVGYYGSIVWSELSDETQKTRRRSLDRFATHLGSASLQKLQREHLERYVDKVERKPSGRHTFIKSLRHFLRSYCIPVGLCRDDPTRDIKNKRPKTNGFPTWTDSDLVAFEAKHPIGSRARLAYALLLFTGQRRADVVLMGRQHLRDIHNPDTGRMEPTLCFEQRKTKRAMQIPVHDDLAAILAALPADNMTFLVTERGAPFSTSHFTNWFRAMCHEAGLPNRSAHGLRKAGCRLVAEGFGSTNVIGSFSGHVTLGEIEHYTRDANQLRMARKAIALVGRRTKTGTEAV